MKLHNPNAFTVLVLVHDLLKDTGRADEWPAVEARMKSGDYRNLCAVAKEVSFGSIEIVDDPEDADCDCRHVVR